VGNEYAQPKDVAGEQRQVFTSHSDAAFDVCFDNVLSGSKPLSLSVSLSRLNPPPFPLDI
jgi:hypothetical protein